MEEETKKKKLSSRKFLIWVVWLVIVVLVIGALITIAVITKNVSNDLVILVKDILGWFFAISIMYMGMNVGQKGVFAFKDFLEKKTEEKKE